MGDIKFRIRCLDNVVRDYEYNRVDDNNFGVLMTYIETNNLSHCIPQFVVFNTVKIKTVRLKSNTSMNDIYDDNQCEKEGDRVLIYPIANIRATGFNVG